MIDSYQSLLLQFLQYSGYPTPEERGVFLGQNPPFQMPQATIDFIEQWVQRVDEKLNAVTPFSAQYADLMDDRLITYQEFLSLFSETIAESEYLYHRAFDFYMIDTYEKKINILSGSKRDYPSYIKMLQKAKTEIISFFLKPLKMKLPLDALQRHMHILAKTGQGKSNLIKLIIHELQQENTIKNRSIILIEPHGDLAREVRDFALNIKDPQRLVYIDPYYQKGVTPVINPFQINDLSDENVDLYAQELSRVFIELLKEGTSLSSQMDAVLRPAISTLLRMENSTLEDLQDLMDVEDEQARARVVQYGLQNPYIVHRKMFAKVWGAESIPTNYKATLSSIYNKIQNLLNTEVFRNLTCGNNGHSTIDLEQEVNQGKLIIFNLSKGKLGTEASQAYGKFIVSTLQTIAFKRENVREDKRVSTFAFIDEFQNYVTSSIESILSEARKYGVHLVLSHQSIGQINDTKLRDTLLGNTGIKAVGTSSKKTLRIMADEINIGLKEFAELQPFEFYIDAQSPKAGKTSKPYRIKPSSYLAKRSSKYYQNREEQKAIQAYQIKKYYASILIDQDKKVRTKKEGIPEENNTPGQEQGQRPKFDL